ncbi:MAG: PqiC family protein [Longimicrobiales bacterium]|nr:PqiC family protein [Longimicrobiales bacterium]
MPRTVTLSLACILLALPGCFSLSRGAPAQKHYVLGTGTHVVPAGNEAPAETGAAGSPSAIPRIGLRAPKLADYLATPSIVVRRGVHRIGFSEFDRWGEDLARGVSRSLAGHMTARLPAHRVEPAPWPPGARPELMIQVHLLRFEGVAPGDTLAGVGEAHLVATWEILSSREGDKLVAGTTNVRSAGWMVGDFDGLVALLDAALATLAEDIILAMERRST